MAYEILFGGEIFSLVILMSIEFKYHLSFIRTKN